MVLGQNTSIPDEKKILPYMMYLYTSHLRGKKVQKKQKHNQVVDTYDYKYNLTKELVRENLIQVRKERKRNLQSHELVIMYNKLACEKHEKEEAKKKEQAKKVERARNKEQAKKNEPRKS